MLSPPCFHRGDPIELQLELQAPGRQRLELEWTLTGLDGQVAFAHRGTVVTGAASSAATWWVELALPPQSLGPGWYSLAASLSGPPGTDFHRSRQLVELADPPACCAARQQTAASRTPKDVLSIRPGSMPRGRDRRRVEQLRIQLEDRGEPLWLPGDAPVRVVARLNLDGLPCADPLLRFQVFSQGGELALGTNTRRWDLSLEGDGQREICIEYARLNLTPGRFPVTVGLWPDELDGRALEARHGLFTLLVGPQPQSDCPAGSVAGRWEPEEPGARR